MKRLPIFTVLAVAVAGGGCGPSSPSNEHATGYKYVPAHHAAFSILGPDGSTGTILSLADGPTTPSSVDNSQWNPPVGDQGEIGSCAAWSSAYSVGGYLSNRDGAGAQLFAPMYIYTQASANCLDCGMEIGEAFGFMENGLATAAAYDAVVPAFTSYGASIPTIGTDAAANDLSGHDASVATPAQALATYQPIFDAPPSATPCAGAVGASSAIQVAISQAYPVVIALPVFTEFDQYDGVHPVQPPLAGEQSRGGHAIMCSKFDADGLWCQNQWGATWGAAGTVQLSWAFVDQCIYEADIGTALGAAGRTTPLPAINAPATGSTLSATATFDVTIAAPVPYAWIEQVNGGLLGTLTQTGSTTDYTLQLDTTQLPTGSWIAIVARTQDADGNVAQSPPIEIRVDNLALVPVIQTPAAGALITETTSVTGMIDVPPELEHGPLETGSPCTSVSIALDGVAAGNATLYAGGEDPATQAYQPQRFAYAFNPALSGNGEHALTAVCVDSVGQPHASAQLPITIGPGIAVQITSPAGGSTLTGTVPVGLTIKNLPSAGGTVSFYLDASSTVLASIPVTTIGTFSTSFNWDTTQTPNNPHTLTARYTDSTGATYASAVAVTVANYEATITAPAAGAVVYGEAAVITAATTTSCESLWIYVDGAPISADLGCSGATVSAPWNTTYYADGPHVITANYEDAFGFGDSLPVTVTVLNNRTSAAQIQLTTPTTGATVAGQVPVSVTVAPGTTMVGFFVDSYSYGSWLPVTSGQMEWLDVPPGTTTMQVTWDSTKTTNGSHTVLAESFDAMGNDWVSPAVSVSVANNYGPQVSFATLTSTTISGYADLEVLVSPGRQPLARCEVIGNGVTIENLSGTFPYGYFWAYFDTHQFVDGPLRLDVECFDTDFDNNEATVNLTVQNY